MRNSIAVFLLAAVAALFVSPTFLPAAVVTVPTGLRPGDQYRLAFVTSTTRDATSSNIAEYNAFVTAAANLNPALTALNTNWTAIASAVDYHGGVIISDVNAFTNTGTDPSINPIGVPIYTLKNSLIANTNSRLWSGSIISPINIDESGNTINSFVWTGTDSSGNSGYPTGSLGEESPVFFGYSGLSNLDWAGEGGGSPSRLMPLYAMSGVLTVVPEPSSIALAAFGLIGLSAIARGMRVTPKSNRRKAGFLNLARTKSGWRIVHVQR